MAELIKYAKLQQHRHITSARSEWQGMPEFNNSAIVKPLSSVIVHFTSEDSINAFAVLIGQKVTRNTRSIWYPKAEIERYADKEYRSEP